MDKPAVDNNIVILAEPSDQPFSLKGVGAILMDPRTGQMVAIQPPIPGQTSNLINHPALPEML